MPAKTSKQSSDREKACRFVLSAFFQQGPKISDLLAALFLVHRRDDDPEPDFFGTIVALGRKLKHAIDGVVSADSALFAANAALDAERFARGKKADRLSRLVIGLRGACNSLFVNLPVQQLGFDARTAQDPVPLLIQADRVVASLESGQVEAELLFEGDDFDPRKYAAQVREGAKDVRTCLDRVADFQRQVDQALLAKRAVTKEYDDLFLQGARTFESYCRLAGETDLADRVRPSESRPGRTEVPPGEEPSTTEESAVDESATEASAPAEAPANASTDSEGDSPQAIEERPGPSP